MSYIRNPRDPNIWESDGHYSAGYRADDGTLLHSPYEVYAYERGKQAGLLQARRELSTVVSAGLGNQHDTRISDSSLYDEVCKNCGAVDSKLSEPCPGKR